MLSKRQRVMSDQNWSDIARQLLTKNFKVPVREYSTYEWGRRQNPDGISVILPLEEAYSRLDFFRVQLPKNLGAFVGTRRWLNTSDEKHPDGSVEFVVAQCETQFDMIRIAHTSDINGLYMTEDVIKRLQKYDKDFGIDIRQAGFDELMFRLRFLPSNIKEFIQDIDEFCPDAPTQVYGTPELMMKQVKASRIVYLWWD